VYKEFFRVEIQAGRLPAVKEGRKKGSTKACLRD